MTSKIHTRRALLTSFMAISVSACAAPLPRRSEWEEGVAFHMSGDPRREVFIPTSPQEAAEVAAPVDAPAPPPAPRIPEPRDVAVDPSLSVDQILVFQDRLVIQHIHAPGQAREYPVGLGKAGLEFSGEAVISRKAEWPSWRPTDAMIARNPGRYKKYADGVPGGPGNPLGARALYLFKDGRDTYYRIHGTDAPDTIGSYVSNGCIRLRDEHVIELYERVKIGTVVRVV